MCLGVPGRITNVEDGLMRMGTVDIDGAALEVCLAYVPEAGVGDHVLVHAGFALAQLDEDEARETLEILHRMEIHRLETPPVAGEEPGRD
jgi:hydrogenase expression/formation protein HypC